MSKYLKFTRNLVVGFSLLTIFGCGADPATNSNSSREVVELTVASDETAATDAPATKANFVATLVGGQTFDSKVALAIQPIALWFWAPS